MTADRFGVLNAFVDGCMPGLSRVDLATWLVLYRETRNGTACVSMASIAARAGCSKRAAITSVKRLRKRDLVVQVFKGNNLQGPSRYRVLAAPPTESHR